MNISKTKTAGSSDADLLLRGDAALTRAAGVPADGVFLIQFTLASRAHPIG
jgi:hypothetical protein